jgi:hypothetical protein
MDPRKPMFGRLSLKDFAPGFGCGPFPSDSGLSPTEGKVKRQGKGIGDKTNERQKWPGRIYQLRIH